MAAVPLGPPTFVARCAGIVSPAELDQLLALLKGMCTRRHELEENEYGMSSPLQGNTKHGTFKMVKLVPREQSAWHQQHSRPVLSVPLAPPAPITWRLVHESLPLKGRQYNELPAAVLEVSEASLCGSYSVQFMCALGCEITHRVVRRSYVFVCSHEDVEVQVTVFQMISRNFKDKPLFDGYAVEARMPAAPEQQVEAARKLGGFCQKLLPMVLLKKV